MTPLDLTLGPPRAPRAQLDELIFLPRSIDKVRATLPGGNPGEYRIAGLTQMLLDALNIPLAAFTQVVAEAPDEAHVAAFVRSLAPSGAYATWNAEVSMRQPRGGNRAEAITAYPWLADREELGLALDVLEEDDRLSFGPGR